MTFDVYPVDPVTHTNPGALNVVPGATVFTQLTEQLWGPPPPGFVHQTMYIRVAVSGTGVTAPTLLLKADAGAPVAAEANVSKNVQGGPAGTTSIGELTIVTVGESPGVFQLRLGFYTAPTDPAAVKWQLGIQNNDAAARDFTWVVADTEDGTKQPWVDAPTAVTFASLINGTDNISAKVANKGTAPLTVSSLSAALPTGFSVTTPLPLTVAEGQVADLVFRYHAPASPSATPVSGAVNLVANPPDTKALTTAGHNQQITVSATTQALEVVLLLDDSGSMNWDKFGNTPASPSGSRWSELLSGTKQFLDALALFGSNRGKFGIARFPAKDPNVSTTYDVVPMTSIPDSAGMSAPGGPKDAVGNVVPYNSTPMGDGMDHVLSAGTTYFSGDTHNRRWLILMTDGADNAGTHRPLEFIAAGAPLAAKNIQLFAVGYGVQGSSDVNQDLLKQLVAGSTAGSQIATVDQPDYMGPDLATALRTAIKSGLTEVSAPVDPSAVFVIGDGEARHEVVITQYDTKALFVISWDTPDAERLRLELVTPRCEVITPENAGQGTFSGVTFSGTDRSNMYLIEGRFLRGQSPGLADGPEDGSSRSRAGTWRFLITSPASVPPIGLAAGAATAEGPDLERYNYEVLTESTLRLDLSQDRPEYFAGDPITVSARLTADGPAVTGASVSLATRLPDGSLNNFLAGLDIPAEFLAEAQQQLAGKDATPILVKQLAARLAGIVFDIGKRSVTIPMTDPDGTGVYRATFADTQVPEHYTFTVTANGVTADGVPFHREGTAQTFVRVKPDPAFTNLDIRQVAPGQLQVTIIPRDRFGNVVLVDPTNAGGFGLVAPGATLGPLTSNLDGSYGTAVTFDPHHPPAIGLQFDGNPVLAPAPVPVPGGLHYVDRVVAFTPGAVAEANQHADPHAALGSVADKPAGVFLSLGAYGQLTVAIAGQVIEGDSDHDITVFVEPDTDRRSYRVEALDDCEDDGDGDGGDGGGKNGGGRGDGHNGGGHGGPGGGHGGGHERWVLLGTSIGVTQSFSLGAADLDSTRAIRITDTSGRAAGRTGAPLPTPGVSVRGVGVREVCEDDGDGGHGPGHGGGPGGHSHS